MSASKTMKAILLEDYNSNLIRALGKMKLTHNLPVQQPGDEEVLVRVESSPVNPSDIAFIRGGYKIVKPLPVVPGFEGTGTIIAKGLNVCGDIIGKRVSFFNQQNNSGAWAEYAVVNAHDTILLEYDLPVEQAACLFVNPFTAYALVEHVLENQHQAIILSAANGQVGEFIRYFAGKHGIAVINLVRKQEHIELLAKNGVKNVLNISDGLFQAHLSKLVGELNVTAAIDAVGGELTGKLINIMPDGSEVLLYGGLSGAPIGGIDPIEIIFNNKVLSGFYLSSWRDEKTPEELKNISKYIQSLFFKGEIKTKINRIFPVESFYEAIRLYISAMSSGKVLLKINQAD
jgi:NADPH:quinone reductase